MKSLILLILFISLTLLPTRADIPSINTVKINQVRGYVRFNEKPVSYASVKITNDDESIIIAETASDSNGYFEFENIKSGSYRLETKADYFVTHSVDIVLKSSNKKSDKVIVLELALRYGECCDVKVVSEQGLLLNHKD